MSGLKLDLPKPKPRTPVAAAVVEQFTGEAKATGQKRRKTPGERVHVILPEDIAMKLRLAAVRQRRSVSEGATEAIESWLGEA